MPSNQDGPPGKPGMGSPFSPTSAGWALLPLRAFMGFTFTFAGLQKLANPGFFRASDPTSFQAQLKEAAQNSPIHALIGPLQHVAVPLGVLLALGELAVGIGTFLGLWARIAAIGGILLSLSLFLTVSFHAAPYYTGSDIVFVFAWLPLLVAGSGGILSVDAYLAAPTRSATATTSAVPVGSTGDGAARGEMNRRTFARKAAALGSAGALGVLLAGLAAGLGRLVGHSSDAADAGSTSPGSTTPASKSPGTTTATTGTTKSTPPGKSVLSASTVALGGSATFNAPKTGDPAVVVQPSAGTFVAFDAVCPHEGCTVAYAAPDKLFICPCHGSQFNGETGALVKGPATRGLTPITIAEGPDGDLYAV
jgi:thiosulfate dehydrogenase [quinone] large subunit